VTEGEGRQRVHPELIFDDQVDVLATRDESKWRARVVEHECRPQ
jgi:hypothetical protein